jgi:hypothetical protein
MVQLRDQRLPLICVRVLQADGRSQFFVAARVFEGCLHCCNRGEKLFTLVLCELTAARLQFGKEFHGLRPLPDIRLPRGGIWLRKKGSADRFEAGIPRRGKKFDQTVDGVVRKRCCD